MKLIIAALLAYLTSTAAVRLTPETKTWSQSQKEACPSQCHCTADTAVCEEWSMTKENSTIPLMPPIISVLSIYKWPEQTISLEDSGSFSNLRLFKVSKSKINQFPILPSSMFQVSLLDLSQNDISRLPSQACKNIHFLTHLNVSHNKIEYIDRNFLEGTLDLLILDLSHNPIMQLNAMILTPIQKLGFLDISHTSLVEFRIEHITKLTSLYYLDLSWNSIQSLPTFYGEQFEVLDFSHNPLVHFSVDQMPKLQKLDVSHTNLSTLNEVVNGLPNIEYLDASYSQLTNLNVRAFKNCKNLKELYLGSNYFEFFQNGVFHGLNNLVKLNLDNCLMLQDIQRDVFSSIQKIESLSLINTGLKVLPQSIMNLKYLTYFSIENTSILCDCHAQWIPQLFYNSILTTNWKGFNPIHCDDDGKMTVAELQEYLYEDDCTPVIIHSARNQWLLASSGHSAVLECNATGHPRPNVLWQTVDHHIIMSNVSELNYWMEQRIRDTITEAVIDDESKFEVLESGHLLIRNVQRKDIGRYKCFAYNAVSNASHITFVGLDATSTRSFFIESVIFGWACAALFLIITLIVQFVRYLWDRLGCECSCCCCCKDRLSPKAKQIRQLLETVEGYKTAQLERLRENYNSQVVGIKESCYFQMEKVRDSYGNQSKNLRNLCDYSTQQISGAKDQYVDQVQTIRDYSTSQMNRVRENYVFQRQRIRKFSAHQLIKLRDTYKYQQKTLNKLLENLPDLYIQNCRTGTCQRSDSIMFDELEDLDIYYKIDFLDGDSTANSSEYYTPNSTLSRRFKNHPSQMHSRNGSNDSKVINASDLVLNAVNTKYTEQTNKPHRRFHLRSFSLISPPAKVHRTPKGHKRSSSASHPQYQFQPQSPVLEEPNSPSQESAAGQTMEGCGESAKSQHQTSLQMVEEVEQVTSPIKVEPNTSQTGSERSLQQVVLNDTEVGFTKGTSVSNKDSNV